MKMVIVPDSWVPSTNTNGILWITGGSVTDGFPQASDEDIQVSAALATGTGCVTGALFQIPNEHTTFSADPIQKSRTEDAIIAFTWEHFLNDASDPTWLLRFPMVKASLRAMDAMSEFVALKYVSDNAKLDKYIVSGASKRGWTTWDVAAVDPNRVIAIVPIVLDAINFVAVEHHQFRRFLATYF
jgi:PhoPQ-activated pathogenicity-related protein